MKNNEKLENRREVVKDFMGEPEIQALSKTSETALYSIGVLTLGTTLLLPGFADIQPQLYTPGLITSGLLIASSLTLNYARRTVQ